MQLCKIMAVLGLVAFCIGGCGTTDPATLAKLATENEDWKVRKAATEKIVDQTVLAKIAIEDEEWTVREVAVSKLADQAVLAKIAIEDKIHSIRRAATEKIVDQTVLAKIATEDEEWTVREVAVSKLADQAVLAKIALSDHTVNVRYTAISHITDQTVLAQIAVEAKDKNARVDATAKLNDQTLLSQIVMNDAYWLVRNYAVSKITDQALIARVASKDHSIDVASTAVIKLIDKGLLANVADTPCFPLVRVKAINKLDDTDSILTKIAFRTDTITSDAGEYVARIKLAMREPRIKLHFPDLHCSASASLIQSGIYWSKNGNGGHRLEGESFYIALYRGEKPSQGEIIHTTWESIFPRSLMTSNMVDEIVGFISAKMTGDVLLKDLLHLSSFTQEDLNELVYSRIPEVRMGAVANITDKALLAKIAAESEDLNVRKTAHERR